MNSLVVQCLSLAAPLLPENMETDMLAGIWYTGLMEWWTKTKVLVMISGQLGHCFPLTSLYRVQVNPDSKSMRWDNDVMTKQYPILVVPIGGAESKCIWFPLHIYYGTKWDEARKLITLMNKFNSTIVLNKQHTKHDFHQHFEFWMTSYHLWTSHV